MGRRWSGGWQVVYKLEQQDQGSGPCQELSRGEEERNGSVSLVREQTLGIQDTEMGPQSLLRRFFLGAPSCR